MNSITIQFESWDQLADKLNAMAAELQPGKRVEAPKAKKSETPAPTPPAAVPEAPAPSSTEPAAASPSDISDDDLRAAGYQAGLKDKAAVKGLVLGYGVSALSQIPAEHRAEALRRLKELAA